MPSIFFGSLLPTLRAGIFVATGCFVHYLKLAEKSSILEINAMALKFFICCLMFGEVGPYITITKLPLLIPCAINGLLQVLIGIAIGKYVAQRWDIPESFHNVINAFIAIGNQLFLPAPILDGMCQDYGVFYNQVIACLNLSKIID